MNKNTFPHISVVSSSYCDEKIAIVGASYLQLPLVLKAKDMGLYTLCFAWEEGAVCRDYVDEFYPISVTDKEQILYICKQKRIAGICSIASDVAAPTVAYVSEKLGLKGNSYASAVLANNKFKMLDTLLRAGVLCPHFQRITSAEQPVNIIFPLIVKPTDRSGSLGVVKVNERNELSEAIENSIGLSFSHEAIVEEYVEGREISVEFISYEGKHYPLQITDKVTTGAPHFVELEHHQPANLSKIQYEEIYALTDKALTALGVTNGASHSEYRITKDGKIYVMEIGARMGGDFIGSDLVQLSTGYDFLRGVIEVALGEFKEPVLNEQHYSGVYFLCQETAYLKPIIAQHALPQVVTAEITDDALRSVTFSADRSGYMIYQDSKKLELK